MHTKPSHSRRTTSTASPIIRSTLQREQNFPFSLMISALGTSAKIAFLTSEPPSGKVPEWCRGPGFLFFHHNPFTAKRKKNKNIAILPPNSPPEIMKVETNRQRRRRGNERTKKVKTPTPQPGLTGWCWAWVAQPSLKYFSENINSKCVATLVRRSVLTQSNAEVYGTVAYNVGVPKCLNQWTLLSTNYVRKLL